MRPPDVSRVLDEVDEILKKTKKEGKERECEGEGEGDEKGCERNVGPN